ncbi:MAG: SEL1-like repeat protein [Proteobacteria bacterium]|nr:SEL1-like repeat protein [Pseudomonadota bacterium]
MILRKAVLIIGFLSLSLGIPNLAHADYERALEASNRGDHETGMNECRADANQGEPKCQHFFGYGYEHGEGVSLDYAKAMHWYRLAAEQGFAKSQNNLGLMYYNAWGVERNYTEAAFWYQLAADHGQAIAQYNLAVNYYYGRGVPQSFSYYKMWAILAAAQGSEIALKYKDAYDDKMTTGQIAEGKRLAQQWVKKQPGPVPTGLINARRLEYYETTFRNGDQYKGEWLQGNKHGRGAYIWANGNRYEGDFVNGKFEGSGKFTYSKGYYCDGEFRNDRLIGGEGRGPNGRSHCYMDGNTIKWTN